MSYENLARSLKALALTVPASRVFEMTVKYRAPLKSAALRTCSARG